jgi:cyclopropane fatty-acyl-phospholipid synthase-like methyltransferase
VEYVIKYDQICKDPPRVLYGGTYIEPLASIGMAHFFYPVSDKFKDGISVLDYGCGAGILSNYLSGQLKDFTYIGLEPNTEHGKERINLAKRYFNDPRCSFGIIDSDLDNALTKRLDVIVLISIFTHMIEDDVSSVLKNLIKVFDHNPHCSIVFSCFIGEEPRTVNYKPDIWERFYGESYITMNFLEKFCSDNGLSLTKSGVFVAQGNYNHQIIKVTKS